MNIFIVGASDTGKSSLAKFLSERYNIKHIQASKWLRDTYKMEADEMVEEYTNRITNISIELLKNDPDFFIDKIREQYATTNIIEGIRNIRDFMVLYNPNTDILIKTVHDYGYKTSFEEDGLKLISRSHDYLVRYLSAKSAYMYRRNDTLNLVTNLSIFIINNSLDEYFR